MTETTKSGHPRGLMVLFFSEMWERFCYYGMRVLLTLYLVKSILKGDAEASLIYGAYTGLVYAAPLLGGKMADQFLGYRWAVLLGALLMSIGEFLILGGNEQFLIIGMGALIVGNGYFKANISTIVGKLYADGDPKRDSGFTIFYIGINIGALLATTVVAYVGETYGFDKGFALAGIGMLVGFFIFYTGRERYSDAAGLDVREAGKKKLFGPINVAMGISIGSLLLIPLCYLLIVNNNILNYIFLGLFIYVTYAMITAGIKEDKETGDGVWKDRMIALILFMIINIVFWACFEQAGTSLTLFADRNVNRDILGWTMPASMTQFFNPAFIIIFGSIFSMMWVKLSAIGKNPSIPMKFAFGILQLGLGFLLTYVGYQFAEDNLVPLLTLLFLYMLHTTGELFLSPIGLSMVTKLSPKQLAGTGMGAWFLSFAIANFLGGQIAALTGSGHGGGGKVDETQFSEKTTVERAFEMKGEKDGFASWESFYVIPEDLLEAVPTKERKNLEIPKNISFDQWRGIYDWVEMRKSVRDNESFDQFMNDRVPPKEITSAEEWLSADNWNTLKNDYKTFIEEDIAVGLENGGISMNDWSYYHRGIAENIKDGSMSFVDSYVIQKEIIQKNSLDKYIHVFSIIGMVLVGISILIALVNAPLKKLMHGVE